MYTERYKNVMQSIQRTKIGQWNPISTINILKHKNPQTPEENKYKV